MGGASEPCGITVVIAETAETSGCKSHFLKLLQTIFSTEQSLEGRFLGGTLRMRCSSGGLQISRTKLL